MEVSSGFEITALFNNIRRPTDKWVFRFRQSSVRRLLLASHYCRALFRYLNCAQRFDYRTLDSSRKLGGVAERFIDGSEKRICRLSFEC